MNASPVTIPRFGVGALVGVAILLWLAVGVIGYVSDWISYRNPTPATMVFRFDAEQCRAVFDTALTGGACKVQARMAWQRSHGRTDLVVFMPNGNEITIPNSARDLTYFTVEKQ